MSLVKFNDPDEFLAELERDRAWIEDDIVRVTQQLTPAGAPHLHRLAVVATAIVRTPTDRRTIVQLVAVQGTYIDDTPEKNKIQKLAAGLLTRIDEELTKMDCDIRAGVYQEPRSAA